MKVFANRSWGGGSLDWKKAGTGVEEAIVNSGKGCEEHIHIAVQIW